LAFDLASFIAGLVGGALVGILAGYLHETETIGQLQERVRLAMLQFEQVTSQARQESEKQTAGSELRRQLQELQDEIRRLYRRPGR